MKASSATRVEGFYQIIRQTLPKANLWYNKHLQNNGFDEL